MLIIVRVVWRRVERRSVACRRRGGHRPMDDSARVQTATPMRAVVRGIARRLVMRKKRGKLWKRYQARGAVNT